MPGGQNFIGLIVGKSGSGKTTLAYDLIERFHPHVTQEIYLSTKPDDYAGLVRPEARYKVDQDGNPEAALQRHRRVFFWVTGLDPRPFLDKLGQAIMRRRNVLLVIDEAHNFFEQGKESKGLYKVLTGGRAQNISVLMITQAFTAVTGGLSKSVLKQCTHLITFQLTEENEVARMASEFAELGYAVSELKRWEPHDPHPPEYAVKNMRNSRAMAVLRDRRNPRRRVAVPLRPKPRRKGPSLEDLYLGRA